MPLQDSSRTRKAVRGQYKLSLLVAKSTINKNMKNVKTKV